jgi:hypothetical protein
MQASAILYINCPDKHRIDYVRNYKIKWREEYKSVCPRKKRSFYIMSRKRIQLACPACRMKLLEVTGHCKGVIVICTQCEASILVDIEENGRMVVRFEPMSLIKIQSLKAVIA